MHPARMCTRYKSHTETQSGIFSLNLTQRHRVTQSYYSLQVSDVNKNLKNPSADVFALCAFVLTSWLCACEQAPAPALTSSLVALQLNTSSEENPVPLALH